MQRSNNNQQTHCTAMANAWAGDGYDQTQWLGFKTMAVTKLVELMKNKEPWPWVEGTVQGLRYNHAIEMEKNNNTPFESPNDPSFFMIRDDEATTPILSADITNELKKSNRYKDYFGWIIRQYRFLRQVIKLERLRLNNNDVLSKAYLNMLIPINEEIPILHSQRLTIMSEGVPYTSLTLCQVLLFGKIQSLIIMRHTPLTSLERCEQTLEQLYDQFLEVVENEKDNPTWKIAELILKSFAYGSHLMSTGRGNASVREMIFEAQCRVAGIQCSFDFALDLIALCTTPEYFCKLFYLEGTILHCRLSKKDLLQINKEEAIKSPFISSHEKSITEINAYCSMLRIRSLNLKHVKRGEELSSTLFLEENIGAIQNLLDVLDNLDDIEKIPKIYRNLCLGSPDHEMVKHSQTLQLLSTQSPKLLHDYADTFIHYESVGISVFIALMRLYHYGVLPHCIYPLERLLTFDRGKTNINFSITLIQAWEMLEKHRLLADPRNWLAIAGRSNFSKDDLVDVAYAMSLLHSAHLLDDEKRRMLTNNPLRLDRHLSAEDERDSIKELNKLKQNLAALRFQFCPSSSRNNKDINSCLSLAPDIAYSLITLDKIKQGEIKKGTFRFMIGYGLHFFDASPPSDPAPGFQLRSQAQIQSFHRKGCD